MRLIDLKPVWLTLKGERIGFVFRSPIDGHWLQSCMFAPTPMRDQFAAYEESLPKALREWVQPCNQKAGWTVAPQDFATMTVTPSLDGSAGGLWHGFIRSGEIVNA